MGQSQDSLARFLDRAAASGWFVRVHTASSALEGRVLGVSDAQLRLVGHRIDIPGINRIERRSSKMGGVFRGAMMGGIALGFTGFVLGTVAPDPDSYSTVGLAIVGGTLGLPIGAAVGLAVERPSKRWSVVWTR
jgi:hypothetical protein